MSGDSLAQTARFLVIMGVSGSGKTTVGRALAARLGWRFHDADDHHPAANIEKMGQGVPLNDADRAPWLAALRAIILTSEARGEPGVLACSALKQRYREALDGPGVRFVYLRGELATIRARMEGRRHFMPIALLESQFAALEEPAMAIVVDVKLSLNAQVDRVLSAMGTPADPT